MVALPVDKPDTTPLAESTEAIEAFELLHVPPAVVLANVVVLPVVTVKVPVISATVMVDIGVTVITMIALVAEAGLAQARALVMVQTIVSPSVGVYV